MKIGKQILKKERAHREEEKKEEEDRKAFYKQHNEIWAGIWKDLRTLGHKFNTDYPHGLDICIQCHKSVNDILHEHTHCIENKQQEVPL